MPVIRRHRADRARSGMHLRPPLGVVRAPACAQSGIHQSAVIDPPPISRRTRTSPVHSIGARTKIVGRRGRPSCASATTANSAKVANAGAGDIGDASAVGQARANPAWRRAWRGRLGLRGTAGAGSTCRSWAAGIGDDGEIGANTTIDRGALGDTVLERTCASTTDPDCHNVRIGAHTAMAGCSAARAAPGLAATA